MNVVVYVSDALRADHVGCYGARFVNTRTIDELAAGGVRFDQAISAAPWTAPVDDVDGHRPLPAPPRLPALGRRARPGDRDALRRVLPQPGTRSGTLRLRPRLPLQGPPRRQRPRHERDARRRDRLAARAPRSSRSSSSSTAGRRTCRTTILHSERKEWRAAKRGGDRGHPGRLGVGARGDARGVPAGRRAPVGGARRVAPRGARDASGCARRRRSRSSRDHGESWGERFADKTAVQGRLPHARRDAVRRDRPGAADRLRARRLDPGVVFSQVALGRPHADAARARRASRRRRGRRSLLPLVARRRGGRPAGGRSPAPTRARSPSSRCACRRGSSSSTSRAARRRRTGSTSTRASAQPAATTSRRSSASVLYARARERRAARAERGGGGDGRAAARRPRLPRDRMTSARRRFYERMFFIRRFEETLLELFSQGKLVGHDAHLHRPGGGRRRRHRPPRARSATSSSRTTAATATTSRSRTTPYGLLCEVMGKATASAAARAAASTCAAGTSTRTACSAASSRSRPGSRSPRSGRARARCRRSSSATARSARASSTRPSTSRRSGAPGPLRRREQPLRAVDAVELELAGSIAARGAAFGIETDELDTTDVARDPRRGRPRRRRGSARPATPFFLVLHTYRFSPHSKGDDNRDPAEIETRRERDPLARRRRPPRRRRARGDRGGVRAAARRDGRGGGGCAAAGAGAA